MDTIVMMNECHFGLQPIFISVVFVKLLTLAQLLGLFFDKVLSPLVGRAWPA